MSEQEHYDAVKALLSAGSAVPLTLGEIKVHRQKGTLPAGYTEVYVSERHTVPSRVGGRSGPRAWRVQTRAIGTTEANARTMRQRAAVALDERWITVSGESAPIFRAVSDDPIGEDNGSYSGLSEYGYTL